MTTEEIQAELAKLPTWDLNFTGTQLEKEFKFADFASAMAFADKIAVAADALDHHPELAISWGKVGVTLSTHDVGGLSEKDFILATQIDSLYK